MTNQRRPFPFEPAPDLPGPDWVAKFGVGTIRRAVSRLWDLDVSGVEHLPRTGPAIIAPNHLSFCDSVFVPAALPRRMWAIGKGEYMTDWKTKHVFPAFGMIPVDRSGGDAAQAALDTAAKVLAGNHLFLIYPEGTRSRSGHLHKGRTGAARLAIRCDVPIIPCGHTGTIAVQKPGASLMKPGLPVSVSFGAPMWARDYGNPGDPRVARRFIDAVMFEISALSGQTYVNAYASKDDVAGAAPSSFEKPKITVPSGRASVPKPRAQAEQVIDLRVGARTTSSSGGAASASPAG